MITIKPPGPPGLGPGTYEVLDDTRQLTDKNQRGSRPRKEGRGRLAVCDFVGDVGSCGHMGVQEATQEECMTDTRARGRNLGAISVGWVKD